VRLAHRLEDQHWGNAIRPQQSPQAAIAVTVARTKHPGHQPGADTGDDDHTCLAWPEGSQTVAPSHLDAISNARGCN
jgi:hypothetical protein